MDSVPRLVDSKMQHQRHEMLTRFTELPPVRHFLVHLRRNQVTEPVELVVLSEVKPVNDAKLTLPGHIRCHATETPTRAWSLGTIGTNDHQLHITDKGVVMSLTNHLTYDGKTVIIPGKQWPIKGLIPFDLGSICDEHIEVVFERISRLAHSEFHRH